MISQINVTESLVEIQNLIPVLSKLFAKTQPTLEERDKILLLALELQKHAAIIAGWAVRK
jgi:hypothetical protein